MCIDKDLTLVLIKRKYGSISAFLDEISGTKALFYQALKTERLVHKDSKTRQILTRLDSEGLIVWSDSDVALQLKQTS